MSQAPLLTRYVASCRFEAARQIDHEPPTGKFSRLHGHGFLASIFVDESAQPREVALGAPVYRGGEMPAMLAEIERCAGLLDYRRLNDIVSDPTDTNVARWFGQHCQVPWDQRRVSSVALQSTPEQGVVVGLTPETVHRSRIWRRYRFQAAHQLPHVAPGHKCGRMHGHGFEVVLAVAATPGHHSVTYETIDRAWSSVAPLLDRQCLNDVDGLDNPTSEILSAWLMNRLRPALPLLASVSVYETASCGATFDGERYRIWKDFTIDSAVRYRHADTERARLHGYTYTLRLHLSAALDDVMGWTVDFGDVKQVFDPVFKSLDHHPLHENPELVAVSDGDTASMAKWLFTKSQDVLPQLVRVDWFETEGCGSSVGRDLQGPDLPLVRL